MPGYGFRYSKEDLKDYQRYLEEELEMVKREVNESAD